MFAPGSVGNVSVPSSHELRLQALAEPGIKLRLIESLSQIAPVGYAPIEQRARLFLAIAEDRLSDPAQSQAALEALRRGIWAERVVEEVALSADAMLDAMLENAAGLLADVYKDFLATKSARVKNARGWSKRASTDSDAWINYAKVFGDNAGDVTVDNPAFKAFHLARMLESVDKIKAAFDLAAQGVESGLLALDVDRATARATATTFKNGFGLLLNRILTGTVSGTLKGAADEIAKQAAKAVKPSFFESGLAISFTGMTAPYLERSVTGMENLEEADAVDYGLDAQKAAAILVNVINDGTDTRLALIRAKFFADTADAVEKVLTLGGFGDAATDRVAIIKGAKLALTVIKYFANIVATVEPMIYVYSTAPAAVEDAVDVLFPEEESGSRSSSLMMPRLSIASADWLPVTMMTVGAPRVGSAVAASVQSPPARISAADPSTISDAAADIVGALATLRNDLASDELASAVLLLGSSDQGGYLAAARRWGLVRSLVLQESLGAPIAARTGSYEATFERAQEEDSGFSGLELEVVDRVIAMWRGVLVQHYADNRDPQYVAERDAAIRAIDALVASRASLENALQSLALASSAFELTPVVLVDAGLPVSDATGGVTVSASPETFTVTADVVNVSGQPLAGLSARLDISSAGNVAIVGSAVVTIGTLAANDGVPGTGADQAEVSWTVRYTGPLVDGQTMMDVQVLEDGGAPAAFITVGGTTMLDVGVAALDSDLDGIPDQVERDYGLDPSTADSDGDADGDGLTNLEEYNLGTDPTKADTDGDGLSDLEEVTPGADGFLTQATNEDSDGDGVGDASDGRPLDASTSDPGERPDEPEVAVSQTSVSLTGANRSVELTVSNAGTGELQWVAVADNDALVTVTLSGASGGRLTIAIAPGFEPGTTRLETSVRVFDATGAFQDVVRVTVILGG